MGNLPKLRFSEFEREWRQAKLGDYGVLITGLTYSPANIVDKGGLLVLRSSNIQNERMAYDDNVYVRLKVKPDAITQPDDILICVRNGSKQLIGKNVLIPKGIPRATHGAFMTVFRGPRNQFIAQWLKSAMYAKQVYVNLGATINSINGSDLKNFNVVFPDDAEQQKIATFLTAVDAKIEQLTKKEELLKQYKKGVMQKISSREIRFKADDGSEFPEWTEVSLADILEYEQPTKYIVNSTEYSDDYDLPVLTAGKTFVLGFSNENDGIYDNLPVIIFDDFTTSSNYVDFRFKVKSSAMKLLTLKDGVEADLRLVYEFMHKVNFPVGEHKRHWISEFQYMTIPLPSKAEQKKIVGLLVSIDAKVDYCSTQLEATKIFKKGLLQQMFV